MRRAAVAAVVLLAACTPGGSVRADPDATEAGFTASSVAAPGAAPVTVHCGYVRWSQKTGTDRDAPLVNLTPQTTTIAAMVALKSHLPPDNAKHPPGSVARIKPTEFQTYTIQATLIGYALEADSDIHMVIQDQAKRTMIVEIPHPSCVGSSPWKAQIAAVRAGFNARHPNPPKYPKPFATVNEPVTVTGVGFFDFVHGQQGVAPNGIELHPLLSLVFR